MPEYHPEQLSSSIFRQKLRDLDVSDPFFISLREDYSGFDEWVATHPDRGCLVHYADEKKQHIEGLLVAKIEHGRIENIEPELVAKRILKICTFKIAPHNTKLGQRFISIICRGAIMHNVRYCYVTVFSKHEGLCRLLNKYGFENIALQVDTGENVYVKDFTTAHDDIVKDFPRFVFTGKRYFWLGIHPEYHPHLFPDSKKKNQNAVILKDCPYTNAIHKIYVCRMPGALELQRGDLLFIYCTKDGAPAHYTGCVTSVCVVEERKSVSEFSTLDDFYQYTHQFNLFTKDELRPFYEANYGCAIKMTYNGVFPSPKPTLGQAKQIVGEDNYWGFFELSSEQARGLLHLGKINESLIID